MITDKQVEAGIAAAKNCPKAAAIYLMDDELKALVRAALEAGERAAWSSDMDAAPQDGTEILIETESGLAVTAFWEDGDWTDGELILLRPKRWRSLPTPPTEGDR